MNQSQTMTISTSTIFRVVLILLGLVFLYIIRDIVIMVFVAVVIAAALHGPADWLQRYRVPRLLAVTFLYLFLLLIFALIISLILPPLAEQIKQLAIHFPAQIEKLGFSFQEWWSQYQTGENFQEFLSKIGSKLTQAASSVFATTVGIFGGLFSAGVILVISFYLTVQEKGVKKFLMSLTPTEHQVYLSSLIERIQRKMGGWLRGQLLLMLIVGILTYIALRLIGLKYALVLALIAGILEIVPYIGPIISAIPAVILGFVQSPFLALLVIIVYILIQQIESQIIAPQVMRRAVGLNPIITIIAILIGAKLAGILGIILAVPITAALAEFLKDIYQRRESAA